MNKLVFSVISLFVLSVLTLSSCKGKMKSDEELRIEQEEFERQVKAEEDSINAARHSEIDSTLSRTEGGRIFGDIRFGMSEKEYEAARIKFRNEYRHVSIDSVDFELKDYTQRFNENGLYSLQLVAKYWERTGADNTKKGARAKTFFYFQNKYGEPDSIKGSSYDYSYALWRFSFKVIELNTELLEMSNGVSGTQAAYATYITFTEPNAFRKAEAQQDSIRNVQRQKELEIKTKQKEIENQL